MPVTRLHCEGYEATKNILQSLEDTSPERERPTIYILFAAAADESGKSWCPDCDSAKPVLEKYIESIESQKDFHLINVTIARDVFRDPQNKFGSDDDFKLVKVPTLMKWKGQERLEEGELLKTDLLQLVFE